MRKHVISLYVLVTILVITQILTVYTLIIKTEQLAVSINKTYTDLSSRIEANQRDTQSNINQLSLSLMTTQTDLNKQIANLKATTSSDFSGIIEQAIPAVVTIKTDVAQGTGFIIDSRGYIVTNAHVLSGAHYAKAYTSDQESFDSSLVGYDANMDIALLKIPGSFSSLELGNSDDVQIGERVIAIGNPLGLSFSVTEGIVSAVNRAGNNNLPYYIQTDVALNPGNSGGPLINKQGQAIGINNFKAAGENIGFALESNYIKESVNEISRKALNATIV